MDLPVKVLYDNETTLINLPHCFLNHLLENGHGLEEVPILCLRLTSVFGVYYCAMKEFLSPGPDLVHIPMPINRMLNVVDDSYIRVERVDPLIPHLIKIQGHYESFGKIHDIKEQLERLLVSIKMVNKGCTYSIIGEHDTPEQFTITDILFDDISVDWGVTVDADIKIDFEETLEGIRLKQEKEEQERKEQERKELEARGYKGEGKKIGGASSRSAWLDRLERQQMQQRQKEQKE